MRMTHVLQRAYLFQHHFRSLAQGGGIADEQPEVHVHWRVHRRSQREVAKLDGSELPEFIRQPQVGHTFIIMLHIVMSLLCETTGCVWRLYSLHHLTATYRNIQSGDKTPQIRGQEQSDVGGVLHRADTSQR